MQQNGGGGGGGWLKRFVGFRGSLGLMGLGLSVSQSQLALEQDWVQKDLGQNGLRGVNPKPSENPKPYLKPPYYREGLLVLPKAGRGTPLRFCLKIILLVWGRKQYRHETNP